MKHFRNPLPRDPAVRVSVLTLAGNVILTVFKLFAGLFGRSGAMVADAVHSASDVGSTILVLAGLRLAKRRPDENHPYGHEKLACVLTAGLALSLFVVGLGIGWRGIRSLLFEPDRPSPTVLALVAAVVSIAAKEGMYHMTIRAAKKAPEAALSLRADAWHHRSDALSSVGSLAGIVGGMAGFPRADALAAVVLSAVVLGVAVGIARDALRRLVDRAADPELTGRLRKAAEEVPGVLSVDVFRTRLFGERVDADVEISVRADLPLRESHAIAEQVRAAVCAFAPVKDCTVHVNPKEEGPV